MKRINLKTIWDNLRNRRGQVFPFFVLILVVVIIATMAYVNLSQVDTHKLDTMNAADAAALAGAATMAQAANAIADINVNYLKPTFWAQFWTGIYRPGWTGVPTSRLWQWFSFASMQLLTYLDCCLSGYKAVQSSAAIAHTTALGSLIEEAQMRQGSATGPREKSRFSIWLDNQRFFDNRDQNPTNFAYTWFPYQYDFDQDRQVQPDLGNYARAEEAATGVKKPDENSLELVPMPPMPQFTIYWGPCWDCSYGVWCNTNLIVPPIFEIWWNQGAAKIAMALVLATTVYNALHDDKAPPGMQRVWVSLVAATIVPMMGQINWGGQFCPYPYPTFNCCFVWNWGWAYYLIPVPWIQDLVPGDAEVQVQVSRFSPTKDLGLWQFQHGNITSGARANMYGGSVNRFPGGYKIRVGEVWDGARNL